MKALSKVFVVAFFSLATVLRAQEISVVGRIQHPALLEASGLAPSRKHPGVYWSHNDTGTPAFLFALKANGESIGAYEVQGARLIDWEAVTTDEEGRLFFADIGTNGLVRTHSAIHRVREPDLSASWGRAVVEETWLIRFPGEREDSESFFIHDGFAYLIAKYPRVGGVGMYRFSLADESSTVLLERVGAIPVPGPVSDASLSPDQSRLALVTDEGVLVLFIAGNPETAPTAPGRFVKHESDFMEGSAFTTDGVLVISEFDPEILLFSSPFLSGAPVISTPLINQSSFIGRRIILEAQVEGFPPPVFEWRFNGRVLPGETSTRLVLTNLTLENSGVYELIASNATGVARTEARLTVTEKKADVRVTEVMSSEFPGPDKADWWELTSFDTEPVDLTGWRFNDSTGGLDDAFVIPGLLIGPGESIVFVERLSGEQFRTWWGETNLTPELKIITFEGAQLSFRATGDSVRLWDNATADDNATMARSDFGAVEELGVSFGYDPLTEEFGIKSVIGLNGAFRAAAGNEVGSPGRISRVRLASERVEGGIQLSVQAPDAEAYILETSRNLTGQWESTGEILRSPGGAVRLAPSPNTPMQFYRLKKQ